MAKTKTPTVVKVDVSGEYRGFVDGRKTLRFYEFTVNLPDLDSYKSVVKNNFSHNSEFMRKKFPDWTSTRTMNANPQDIARNAKGKPTRDVTKMTKLQLLDLVEEEEMPINLTLHNTVAKLRQAILDFKEAPEEFEEFQAKQFEKQKEKLEQQRILEELNDDFEGVPESERIDTKQEKSTDDDDGI